jgi:acetoin utilization deacetylase AcuC-like enzyme
MRLYYSDAQLAHRPQQFMAAGRIVAPLEVPERAERLASRLAGLGLECHVPGADPRAAAGRVHAAPYLAFLETAHARFATLANAGPEVLPNVHPYAGAGARLEPRPPPRTTSVVGEAGWYMGDLAVAIGPGTFEAALASAAAAATAAADVTAGAPHALALCRPPGHHAYADRASGFCFLNNAAIAAEVLRTRFARVAILDFDTHHGDGTQAIFYSRDDVFFGSVHTDPTAYYPFYSGYADECGAGAGAGANLNLPLAEGSGDEAYLAANGELILAALAFGAEALVLSAGWDAHRDDPLSRLTVTSDAFAQLGRRYGELPLPTVIVQEGGYALAAMEEAAPRFVAAFLDEHRPR